MAELSIFSEDEVLLLASLPYRAGMYVSEADDDEGEADDEREMRALSACLRSVAQKYDGPGLVDDIFRETMAQKALWGQWAEQSFDPLPDCERAVALLNARAGEGEAKVFRTAILEVVYVVASAYGEFVDMDDIPEEKGFFSALADKIVSGFSNLSVDDEGHPSNVSAAEDSAIARLSESLNIKN